MTRVLIEGRQTPYLLSKQPVGAYTCILVDFEVLLTWGYTVSSLNMGELTTGWTVSWNMDVLNSSKNTEKI